MNPKAFFYCVVMAFSFYVYSAIMSAAFVPSLDMGKNYCVDWIAPDGETQECYRFRNKFEERKYQHNQEMVNRKRIIIGIGMLLMTIINFGLAPSSIVSKDSEIASRIGVSAVVAFFIWGASFIFVFVLPPPIDWFPDVFREVRFEQEQAALRLLR